MPFTIFRFPDLQKLIFPDNGFAWLIWTGALLSLIALAWQGRPDWKSWGRQQWLILSALSILTPIATALFVFRLPLENSLPIPGLAAPAFGPLMPILLTVPWMLASALFGAMPGILLALLSGLIMAAGDTRSLFTPLEYGLMAAALSFVLRQNYRTPFFVMLRKAWFAAFSIAALYPFIYMLNAFLWLAKNPSLAIDFTTSRVLWASLSLAIPLIVSGLLISIIGLRFPQLLPRSAGKKPSPAEASIQARVYAALVPIAVLLFFSLAAVVWIVAGRASRQLLTDRMRNSAEVAASTVPFMLETGQNLILQIADEDGLLSSNTSQLTLFLEESLRRVPYFEQLVLIDHDLETIAAFPIADFQGIQPTQDELDAINRAFGGIPVQTFTVPPLASGSESAQLSFIAAVFNNAAVEAVLLGRSQIDTNPFSLPIIESLDGFANDGGQGLLLDHNGRIAYQKGGANLLEKYSQLPPEGAGIVDQLSPEGLRRMVAYQPAVGSNWSVLVQLPTSLVQQLALDIALPQLFLLLLLGMLAFLILRISLARVSSSVEDLMLESKRIASGDFQSPLAAKENDEFGRLGEAFEDMRQSLQKRLDESKKLLTISKVLTADFDVYGQMEKILEAALITGASSARIILAEPAFGKNGQSLQDFGGGKRNKSFRQMDSQIQNLSQRQAKVLLNNPARASLDFGRHPVPAAIAIFALQHGEEHFGNLWLTFENHQNFDQELVDYLETLASQAGAALAKARIVVQSQLDQKRVHSLLQATPDPMLVLNTEGQILLLNNAAISLLALDEQELLGKNVQDVAEFSPMAELLSAPSEQFDSLELQLGSGRTFKAHISEISSDEKNLGRAIVLRDITPFKQAEAIRSEFLATVSHELQDPIELLRGYLTMLDMVGDLNDKQAAYIAKISQSVDSIANLIHSLLDLERIENEMGLQISTFSVREALEEVLAEISARAKQKQIEISLRPIEANLTDIIGDRTLIQRALYNLLDNAIRHSPRAEQVEVLVTVSADNAVFAIKDNGAGIAPMDLPHVFERLRRGQNQATKHRGGLGLSIVKSIFERHGGRVWAESKLGEGSAFLGEIPIHPKKIPE